METVVLILFVLVCFCFVLKQTFMRPLQIGVTALAVMLFTGLSWRGAVLQSSTQIAGWLADTGLVQDISVILNLDVLMTAAFCLLAVDAELSRRPHRKARLVFAFLRLFPGIMILPVMFGILVGMIFALPGIDFALVSWSLGTCFLVAIPLLAYLMKRLIPETFLRLELLFLCNLLIALAGLVATVNGKTVVQGADSTDLSALAGITVLVTLLCAAGILWERRRIRRRIRRTG